MKKIIILTLSILALIGSTNIVFASTAGGLVDKSWELVRTLAWIGYAVALGMMVYIGIKYMLGSVDAKANMKQAISNYIIGAAFVFCASTIAMVIVSIASSGYNQDAGGLANQIVQAARSAAEGSNNSNP